MQHVPLGRGELRPAVSILIRLCSLMQRSLGVRLLRPRGGVSILIRLCSLMQRPASPPPKPASTGFNPHQAL